MTQAKKIHIVSFQTPYPANYGGAIDVYYKALSLKRAGCFVILHCFEYKGRGYCPELLDIADEVYMYKRETSFWKLFSLCPYIVNSRNSKSLLNNLLKDDAPILFEGIHTTYLLTSRELRNRRKIVRTHNIESDYFWHLSTASKSIVKKLYYLSESIKLRLYEPKLKYADVILAITEKDRDFFASHLNNKQLELLPCFHNGSIKIANQNILGKGDYVLYNGNLGIEENIKACLYLIRNVVPLTPDIKWIFAGYNPHPSILTTIKGMPNIKVVANPSEEEMNKLITEAGANVLITFQATGIKLKLLATLYKGGHCIVNDEMVESTGLAQLCKIANNPEKICQAIYDSLKHKISDQDLRNRYLVLSKQYSNDKNIETLIKYL